MGTKLEPTFEVYDGAATDKTSMEGWINKHYHGLTGYRTTDNAKDFAGPSVVAYYGVDYVKNIKGTNYWRNRVWIRLCQWSRPRGHCQERRWRKVQDGRRVLSR